MSTDSPAPRTTEWPILSLLSPAHPKPTTPVAVLVLNQPLRPSQPLQSLWSKASLRVAADGGANHLHALELSHANPYVVTTSFLPAPSPSTSLVNQSSESPGTTHIHTHAHLHAIIGDLDSLTPEARAYFEAPPRSAQILHDPDQESTDFGKAVSLIRERLGPPVDIVALGGLGGRVDQGLSQLHHLYLFQTSDDYVEGRMYILSRGNISFLLHRGRHIIHVRRDGAGRSEDIFGKHVGIVPLGESSVITTRGLEWDVTDWPTSFAGRMSTSNHVLPETMSVEVETTKTVLFTIALRDTES